MVNYLFSKLLASFILPLNLSILLLIIYVLKKKFWILASAFMILVIFSNYFISNSLLILVEKPWKRVRPEAINNADAIVVLSGEYEFYKAKEDGQNWNNKERFNAGIELYRSNKSKYLIFTGGTNPFHKELESEGNLYIKRALKLGLNSKGIFSTKNVYNTKEESFAVKELINDSLINNKNNNIILITSAYHMKRSKKLFERRGFFVTPYPVDFSRKKVFNRFNLLNPLNWIPNSKNLNDSTNSLRELIGRTVYRIY